jgi:ubiquinone/menaquinone biosynthesis C-methylase UbiE
MSSKLDFDEKASRQVELIYSTPDMVGQRGRVLQTLELKPGERVLDIGVGPGFLSYDMALSVGPKGRVVGTDISENMLEMSRKRCADQPWAKFQTADATELSFPDEEFEVAVSTQVLEYVQDVDTALSEIWRVLRSGGRVAIIDTDMKSFIWHSTDKARMDKILKAWDEHLANPHLPRTLTLKLRNAGFAVQGREIIPMFNPEYHENIYSHGMMDLISSFVPGRNGVTKEEVEAWAEDLRELGERGEYFFSLNRYLFLAVKLG